jgi:hypothetical protein
MNCCLYTFYFVKEYFYKFDNYLSKSFNPCDFSETKTVINKKSVDINDNVKLTQIYVNKADVKADVKIDIPIECEYDFI